MRLSVYIRERRNSEPDIPTDIHGQVETVIRLFVIFEIVNGTSFLCTLKDER